MAFGDGYAMGCADFRLSVIFFQFLALLLQFPVLQLQFSVFGLQFWLLFLHFNALCGSFVALPPELKPERTEIWLALDSLQRDTVALESFMIKWLLFGLVFVVVLGAFVVGFILLFFGQPGAVS